MSSNKVFLRIAYFAVKLSLIVKIIMYFTKHVATKTTSAQNLPDFSCELCDWQWTAQWL